MPQKESEVQNQFNNKNKQLLRIFQIELNRFNKILLNLSPLTKA
jgi:hypothetical protein